MSTADSEKNSLENAKADDDQHGPKLHFDHIASVQEVKFRASWSDSLQTAWDTAYSQLAEDRRADDRLQSDDGTDMMPFVTWTLRQLFDDKNLKTHKFEIVGPTGGATP